MRVGKEPTQQNTAGFSDLKDALIRKLLWNQVSIVSIARTCCLNQVVCAVFFSKQGLWSQAPTFTRMLHHQGPRCPSGVGEMVTLAAILLATTQDYWNYVFQDRAGKTSW